MQFCNDFIKTIIAKFTISYYINNIILYAFLIFRFWRTCQCVNRVRSRRCANSSKSPKSFEVKSSILIKMNRIKSNFVKMVVFTSMNSNVYF